MAHIGSGDEEGYETINPTAAELQQTLDRLMFMKGKFILSYFIFNILIINFNFRLRSVRLITAGRFGSC